MDWAGLKATNLKSAATKVAYMSDYSFVNAKDVRPE
jgi:hypothetical protein